jgi:hypothetical protein
VDALRPLSLDQFAAMTAEMEAGFPRDRVLESASVSAEQWELTQETWLLRMAKQGAQRKLALLDRYNELLAKHRKAAQRKMRVEKRKLKGPMPVPAEAHLSPLARARPENAATGATFQKGTPGGDGAARASAWTVSPATPPMVAGAAGAAAPIITPPPAAVEISSSMAILDEATLDTDTLDEGARDERARDDRARDEESTRIHVIPALTAPAGPAWLSGPQAAPRPTASGGLPFQRPDAQAAKEQPAPRPTASGGLPFQRPDAQAAKEQPAPRPTASGGLPFQRPATNPAAAAAAAPAPRPGVPPPAPATARLSIEQIAWLQAQMDTSPELGRAAREQLGMSEADYATERAVWQARFQQDRAIVERYSQLFYHYRRPRA